MALHCRSVGMMMSSYSGYVCMRVVIQNPSHVLSPRIHVALVIY